jgi:hypothetical protein
MEFKPDLAALHNKYSLGVSCSELQVNVSWCLLSPVYFSQKLFKSKNHVIFHRGHTWTDPGARRRRRNWHNPYHLLIIHGKIKTKATAKLVYLLAFSTIGMNLILAHYNFKFLVNLDSGRPPTSILPEHLETGPESWYPYNAPNIRKFLSWAPHISSKFGGKDPHRGRDLAA